MPDDAKPAPPRSRSDHPPAAPAGRPAEPRVLTFEDVGRFVRGGPRPEDIVPIEHVRDGDGQVRAGNPRPYGQQATIVLDPLADVPSVRSIYATTTLELHRPLPHVEELIMTVDAPTRETLANLPNLRRLAVGRYRSAKPTSLDTMALPPTLEALNVARHALVHGWLEQVPDGAPPRFSEIAALTGLRALTLRDCWPGDSVAPLATLTHLTHLDCDAPNGWSALKTLTALETVVAVRPKVANLRALRTWTRVRSLTLGNAGVKRLAGLEAFQSLERLTLFLLTVADLTPISRLPRLAHVVFRGLSNVTDLSALATLPSLRHLEIEAVGDGPRDAVRLRSLAPLAGAGALETLSLVALEVEDGDATPLIALPSLRHAKLSGDFGESIDALRSARPDMTVEWRPPVRPSGEVVGVVRVHSPLDGTTEWWISDDLTGALGVRTNADAERRLRSALRSEAPELLARLDFDTEADAVVVRAPSREDIMAVARLIERAAAKPGR